MQIGLRGIEGTGKKALAVYFNKQGRHFSVASFLDLIHRSLF
jgi:hypothetical protein